MNTLAGWRKRLTDFLFPDESDEWLTLLRLGLGLQIVLYALSAALNKDVQKAKKQVEETLKEEKVAGEVKRLPSPSAAWGGVAVIRRRRGHESCSLWL